MQAADYVKYADLVAAGIASQSKEMQEAIKAYKQAVAEWDTRNNLSKELAQVQAAKTELANAQVLFSREQDAFKLKVAEFNAMVEKAAKEDTARKELLTAQAKKVDEAMTVVSRKEAEANAAIALRTATLDKKAAELAQLEKDLNTRESEIIRGENKLKAAQVTLGKVLA